MKYLYKEKTRQILYLDQFAVSNMFESNSIEWKRIKQLVLEAVGKCRLICPIPIEHFLESSQKDIEKAVYIDSELSKLSGGYGFKPELYITSQLIISLIRNNNITLKTFLYEGKDNVLESKTYFNQFNSIKKEYNEKSEESTFSVNEIRKSTRLTKTDGKLKEQLFKVIKSLPVDTFIKRLESLIENRHIYIEGQRFPSGDIPHWVDQILYQLIAKHQMKKKESYLLLSHLKTYGFSEIPTLDIRTSLEAIISAYNKKETVNDHIDIMRISIGLPISDILITDKKRKNELLELQLDTKYNTVVFDGTKNDLEKLACKLERINSLESCS